MDSVWNRVSNGVLNVAWQLPSLFWGLAVVAFALGLGLWFWRWARRYRRRRIAKRAQSAERAALGLLRSHGYTVIDTQVRRLWAVQHGERSFDVHLRADVLVRRGQRRLVAEVKSTPLVADLKHGPTRRQLLEYAIAYGADGVLLVDMHSEQIEEISFPGLRRWSRPHSPALVTVAVVGLMAGLWLGSSLVGWT